MEMRQICREVWLFYCRTRLILAKATAEKEQTAPQTPLPRLWMPEAKI